MMFLVLGVTLRVVTNIVFVSLSLFYSLFLLLSFSFFFFFSPSFSLVPFIKVQNTWGHTKSI